MPTRLACLFVPMFPLAARLRSEPELLHEAVVITEGNGNAAYVIAATRRARKAGIRPGLSLPQSRAIMPKLIARARDAECERSAQEALLESGERLSPRVENAGDGIVFLDLHGLDRHWMKGTEGTAEERSLAAERALGQAAIQTVEAAGMPVRVGIASSKLAAKIAAELPESPTIVPRGKERAFLAPLPLARLSPELEIASTLTQWGLTSIGDLARLPEGEVASRLGDLGRELHWSARGVDPRPLMPRSVPQVFEEGMDLEWPLVELEPFLFVANAAIDRLAKRLEYNGLSCRKIELTLRLEPDGFYSRGIEMPAPTRDVKTMLTLMKLDLEANPPGGPVAGFTFVAHPDRPRRAQLSLFGPPALSPDKLATTIAKIASMVGTDRVGTPATVNGYRPERFGIASFQPPPPPETRRTPRKNRGLLAIRVLRPAMKIEVQAKGDSDDLAHLEIHSVQSNNQAAEQSNNDSRSRPLAQSRTTSKPLDIHGAVKVASGPWTLEEGWWSDEPVERDYWDLELATGGIYRVFRERASGSWFADGIYD